MITLDRTNSTILTARLAGYEDMRAQVRCGISPWIFGNSAGQFYPRAFMGVADGSVALLMLDMSTGSFCELSPSHIHFKMIKKGEKRIGE